MNLKTGTLFQRRLAIDDQRTEFESNHSLSKPGNISPEILHSWQRSANTVKSEPQQAPIDDKHMVSHLWNESPLSVAAKSGKSHMIQLVKEGDLVAAISDPNGRLLWTHSSGYMRRRAENLNFTAGGHWGEQTVGTNAVGLSLKLKRPITVFSSEHYLPFVQDWVCYAAPIIHPQSGECVGALDISTTWNKHTPLGQSATAQLAHSISRCLPNILPRAELEIHALGYPKIIFQGQAINLPPRQLEILCLLALNPDGIDLESLHAALYGDMKVSVATLKADVSHLRSHLKGKIKSRPYRLNMSVWADFIAILGTLDCNKVNEALSLYRGSFLARSESPEIKELSYCIDAMMSRVIETYQAPDKLIKEIQRLSGNTLLRERLMDMLS